MKKAKTFLLLGITLCMFGCSDDDDDKSNTTSTVPFSLTASLEAVSYTHLTLPTNSRV